MQNIEVSGELDMGERGYGDLTFSVIATFSHFGCTTVKLGNAPIQ
jgi:hypothetical protein